MKVTDMKPIVAYRVTKGSSDGTFMPGQIIWLSKQDGTLCIQGGALDLDEWVPEAVDFEVEEDHEHYIKGEDGEAILDGCCCCVGDSPLYWKDNENNAFIDSKGEVQVTVNNKTITFPVKYCPSCGRRF